MLISVIVAHDSARVIGRDGGMPWHLPADLGHFKRTTMGHHLIVGRKTFASIGRALPGRKMIVVSRGEPDLPEGVELAHSLDEALTMAEVAGEAEVFIAGGGEIYRQALARADRLFITLVGESVEAGAEPAVALAGDTLFPEWEPAGWRCLESIERLPDASNTRPLHFQRYERLR